MVRFLETLAGLLALLAVQIWFLQGAWLSFDLRLWDGSWYWGWGRDIATALHFPAVENAPLYSAYYALFHLLFDDPFTIYFAHRVVMLIAISVLLYALLRAVASPLVALLLGAYFLLLIGDNGVADYAVRPFVLIPVLAGYLLALGQKPFADVGILAAFLAAALVRPEFVSALPFLVIGLPAYHRLSAGRFGAPSGKRLPAIAFGFAASAALALLIAVGNNNGRSWLAFGQHYAAGQCERGAGCPLDPWQFWPRYTEAAFGGARSIGEAAAANPSALFAHVAWNIRSIPRVLDGALKPDYALASPIAGILLRGINLLHVVGAALIYLAWREWRERRAGRAGTRRGKLIVVVLSSLAPVAVTSLLIRPSPEYLFVVKAAALLPIASVLERAACRIPSTRLRLALIAVLAAAFLLIFPTPFSPPRPRVVLPAVRALPRVPGSAPYGLIADSAISFCNYSRDPRCQPIEILFQADPPPDVGRYIESTNTRLLLVGARLPKDLSPPWRAYVLQLVANPARLGWRLAAATPAFAIYQRNVPPPR